MNIGEEKIYKVDKESSLPLHRQLKEIIKRKIEQGEFKPGDRIPTEYELCNEFAISRAPVRQALTDLVNEGFLYRQQGSGTFVNHKIPSETKLLQVMVTEDLWVPSLKKATRLYNRGRQGEKVRLKAEILGRPQLHSKIVSAVGQGEAPDLALIDWVWMTEFADLQYIEPLDELDREWVGEFKADILPLFVENNSYRGHLYGGQIEASVAVIWYRKDIFVEEGLSPPRSWEELVVVAQYLQDEEVRKRHHLGPFPLAFPAGSAAGETTTYILIALIWAAGGEIISGERVVLDEGSRQALEFLRDLVHKHQVASPDASSYGFNEVPKLFARGEVALAFGGSYEKALIQEVSGWDDEAFRKRVGFIPIPAGPEGRLATTVGGMVYVIFRQSPYPQAALEILKLLASPPLMREFCRKTGRRPTQGSVARALDPERDWFIYETNELLEMARVRPTIPQYARISQQLQVMVASILEQRESIDEAIARAQAVIEALA